MSLFVEQQYQQALETGIDIKLPVIAEILVSVNNEISLPFPDVLKISQLIAKDIALSKSVLSLVNSPLYRLPRHITNIRLAVTLLGIGKIKTAILMPALNSALAIKLGLSEFLWKVPVLKAICAAKFSEYIESVNADDGYIAGLFSRSGQLVLAQQKTDYQYVLQQAIDENKSIEKVEFQQYSANSSFLAFKLSELWQLPVPVMAAILLQNIEKYSDLDDERIRGIIAVLIASDDCISELFINEPLNHLLFPLGESRLSYALDELAVSQGYFNEIKIDIHDELLKYVDEVLGY